MGLILEEEIDKSALLTLTEDMLKELIPKIGLRSKFYSKLLELKSQYKNIQDNNLEEVTIYYTFYKNIGIYLLK